MEKIFKAILSETDLDSLKKLIESGENVDAQDKDKRTPLIHAAIDNKIDLAKVLIEKGANINIQDSLGYTPLHYAAQNYYLEFAKLLIDNNAKVDSQDIHGNTPLFRAVFNAKGRGEVINLLTECGADKNLVNNHGISPLQLAKTIANYDVAQFLE
ncbi:ankyrin repeat domain-containing protein [Aminipila terrae]|uniref:Ankyrin repeat domain-containing protein n=1 Tax=Aminipila terrae TaxID=2697030 RepID=A0A6P1MP61_9FIRM|nr:ankyrin repeat domain-containing protein [Aminipila terrae]QHI73466.1 ankyrin repeat domain-containing protein [Aminipila terrae]